MSNRKVIGFADDAAILGRKEEARVAGTIFAQTMQDWGKAERPYQARAGTQWTRKEKAKARMLDTLAAGCLKQVGTRRIHRRGRRKDGRVPGGLRRFGQ